MDGARSYFMRLWVFLDLATDTVPGIAAEI